LAGANDDELVDDLDDRFPAWGDCGGAAAGSAGADLAGADDAVADGTATSVVGRARDSAFGLVALISSFSFASSRARFVKSLFVAPERSSSD
jgi:hypothetical protein